MKLPPKLHTSSMLSFHLMWKSFRMRYIAFKHQGFESSLDESLLRSILYPNCPQFSPSCFPNFHKYLTILNEKRTYIIFKKKSKAFLSAKPFKLTQKKFYAPKPTKGFFIIPTFINKQETFFFLSNWNEITFLPYSKQHETDEFVFQKKKKNSIFIIG